MPPNVISNNSGGGNFKYMSLFLPQKYKQAFMHYALCIMQQS